MIGIIGAMDIEIDGFSKLMSDVKKEKNTIFEFISGKIGTVDVVAVVCGIGKVSAAICAQYMIDKYSPSFIINTGVAGGLSKDLDISDIAVATDVVQHDIDTTIFGDPKGYITNLGIVNIPVKENIWKKIEKIAQNDDSIKTMCGTIASGDQFINTPYQKNVLKDEFDAIACEMEGAAIGQVCYTNNVDFAVIRAISDSATGDALMDYETFKEIAAQKTIKIVTEYIKSL